MTSPSEPTERAWPVRGGRWGIQQRPALVGMWSPTTINCGFTDKAAAEESIAPLNDRGPDQWAVFDRFPTPE